MQLQGGQSVMRLQGKNIEQFSLETDAVGDYFKKPALQIIPFLVQPKFLK